MVLPIEENGFVRQGEWFCPLKENGFACWEKWFYLLGELVLSADRQEVLSVVRKFCRQVEEKSNTAGRFNQPADGRE